MGQRGKVEGKPGAYVERDRLGRFKKWTSVGRSLAADRRKRVGRKRIPKTKGGKAKSGYGHQGDYKRKKTTKRRR